jgi:tRNA pseudouridine38-40 synthase
MRYIASVGYDGSKYYGFQKLNGHKTIQNELEKTLTKINKTVVVVKGAGRTDRGVHAFNQMIHFDLDVDITPDELKKAINSIIDDGIHINYCEIVDDNFHARFDVKLKIYEYVINLGEYDPIDNDYIYNYGRKLNIKKMKQAAKYLLGFHSYKAYSSNLRENYNSVIYKIKFTKKKDILVIRFEGKTFYRYMVRNLMGGLIMVGEEKIEPLKIKEMLDKEKNLYNYSTAPANGLYLVSVMY